MRFWSGRRLACISVLTVLALVASVTSIPATAVAADTDFMLQAAVEPTRVMRGQRVDVYAALYALRGVDVTVVMDAVDAGTEAALPAAVGELQNTLASHGIQAWCSLVKLPTWFSSAGNMRRSGYSYYEVGTSARVKWKQRLNTAGFVDTTVLIGPDGTLYVGGMDGRVYAVRSADGSILWTVDTGGVIQTPGTIGPDGTLYFGNRAGKATAITQDGKVKWTRYLGGGIECAPAMDQLGRTYWAAGSRYWCLDPAGNVVWSLASPGGNSVFGDPSVGPDGTVYFSGFDGVAAVTRDGKLKWFWSYGQDKYNKQSPLALDPASGTVYVGNWIGDVIALRTSDGYMKWKYRVRDSKPVISPSLSADGQVFAVDYINQGIIVFSPGGSVLSRIPLGTYGVGEITVTPGKNVLFTAANGKLLCVSATKKTVLWEVPLGVASENQPSIDSNGTVYVATEDGYLWAIDTGLAGQARKFSNLFWEEILVNYAKNSWVQKRYPVVIVVTSAPWDDFSDERQNFLDNLAASGAMLYITGNLSPTALSQAIALTGNSEYVFSPLGNVTDTFKQIAAHLAKSPNLQAAEYRLQADSAWVGLPDGSKVSLTWDPNLRRYYGSFTVPDGGTPGVWPGDGTYTVSVVATRSGVTKTVNFALTVQGNIKKKVYVRQLSF